MSASRRPGRESGDHGSPRIEFAILGPLEVRVDGRGVELGSGKERALLAVLLLHAGRVVPVTRLVDELWGADIPASATKMVQIFVSQLRKRLPPGVLDTQAPGYRLALGGHELDLRRFEQLALAGRSALRDGRVDDAGRELGAALALWRGPALAEFAEPFAEVEGARLAEQQLACLEDRIEADLASGRHHLLVAELDALVRRHPLRERLRGQLMVALYRAGRQAEALETYQSFRRLLADDVGIEPSAELKELERLVLRQDESLTPPAKARAVPSPASRLPERLVPASATSFVGRSAELARLSELFDRAAAGEGSLVVLAGEGGIGKTRLIAELASRAAAATVLYGRCDENEAVPFGPWVELLSRLVAETPDPALAATLGRDAATLARLVPDIASRLPGVGGDARREPDPELERRRLYSAVAALVERLAARQPVIAVLDDLHWADRSSLLLLQQLAAQETLGRVLIVATYRDTEVVESHALARILGDLERDRPVERLRLSGLDAGELASLAAAVRGSELPPEAIQVIHRETNGNPFFLKQLLRHLDELPVEGRSYRVPAGLRDVIVTRVSRLPGDAPRVLKIASLIGREFELALLQSVGGISEDELLDVLDAAVQAGVLLEVSGRPGRYAFAHALLRTTLEQELTATRRARIHAALGEAIEARYASDLDRHVDVLARHFTAGGAAVADRALAYSLRAGERAAARLAYDEAAAYFATAVELHQQSAAHDAAASAELRLRLGDATSATGRWEEARDVFAAAADASRAAGAPELFARAALGHAGGNFERYGLPDQASALLLDEALGLLPHEDSPLRAQILARLGAVLYYLHAPVETQTSLSRQGLEMARRLGDDAAVGRALAAAQYAYWRPGGHAKRLELAHELVAVSERLADPYFESGARIWRAIALLDHCRLDEADRDLDRFAQLAAELRMPELLGYAASHRAMRALLEGRWADGERAAAEVLELAERRETANARQSYGVEMLQLRHEQGRLGEMTDHYQWLADNISALPGWRTALAWAHVQAGRDDLARAEVDALRRDEFAALPRDANLVPACAILGHLAAETGDADLAAAIDPLLRENAPYWVVMGYGPATLGPVAFTLGLASQLTGLLDQAVEDYELALERSAAMRAVPYVAHASIHLAQVLAARRRPGDVRRARTLRAEGVHIARTLQMTRLLRTEEDPSAAAERVAP